MILVHIHRVFCVLAICICHVHLDKKENYFEYFLRLHSTQLSLKLYDLDPGQCAYHMVMLQEERRQRWKKREI